MRPRVRGTPSASGKGGTPIRHDVHLRVLVTSIDGCVADSIQGCYRVAPVDAAPQAAFASTTAQPSPSRDASSTKPPHVRPQNPSSRSGHLPCQSVKRKRHSHAHDSGRCRGFRRSCRRSPGMAEFPETRYNSYRDLMHLGSSTRYPQVLVSDFVTPAAIDSKPLPRGRVFRLPSRGAASRSGARLATTEVDNTVPLPVPGTSSNA